MKHQLDFEKQIVELQHKLEELKKHPETHSLDISLEQEVELIEGKIEETKRQIFSNLSAWDRIKIARHPKRPFTLNYLESAFTDFTELHGDRLFAEDRAVAGGFAQLGAHKVMAIGTQKGRDTKENIMRNFGSAHPEGYRKALRLMKMAAKFGLPIITLIDTARHRVAIGLVDEIIPEPLGGAHNDPDKTAETVRDYLLKHLEDLRRLSPQDRLKKRYEKFRAYGHFAERQPPTEVATNAAVPAEPVLGS